MSYMEIARAKLNWQEAIYQNALDLIDELRKDPDPDKVQEKFAKRPVGKTREQLLTAYAQYHLSRIASDRYEKLSEDQALHAIDYLMWSIWCAEWLINAMIWVTLAGFLAMSYRALSTRRFRAPIATVVHDKLYRPFLQMSSQGASILLKRR